MRFFNVCQDYKQCYQMDKRNGRGRRVRERYNVKITTSLWTICWNENYIVIQVNKASCSTMNFSSIVYIDHLFITHQIVKFNFEQWINRKTELKSQKMYINHVCLGKYTRRFYHTLNLFQIMLSYLLNTKYSNRITRVMDILQSTRNPQTKRKLTTKINLNCPNVYNRKW